MMERIAQMVSVILLVVLLTASTHHYSRWVIAINYGIILSSGANFAKFGLSNSYPFSA